MEVQKLQYEQVALQFAQALVSGHYELSYSLLSSSLQEQWSPLLLEGQYENMVDYFQETPNYISVELVDTTMPGIGLNSAWVYVSIAEDGNGEAVTVVIGEEQGRYLIKEIEWGRP